MQTRALGIEATLKETEFIWLKQWVGHNRSQEPGAGGSWAGIQMRDDDKLLASPGLHFLICQQEEFIKYPLPRAVEKV